MRVIALVLALFSTLVWAEDESGVEVWESLLPESERGIWYEEPEINHDDPMAQAQQNLNVSLNEELNNTPIRIPGFVVPLEGDQDMVTEFLLVPYFGACIHYPPPPPNQIVYVTTEKGFRLEDWWEPVWVEGTIRTEIRDVQDMATVGYAISEPSAITLYDN